MKNAMLPESELKILGEIFQKVDELTENHQKSPLDVGALTNSSELEQLHIMFYLDLLRDVVVNVKTLKDLLEISEEDLVKTVTEDGKVSLKEVKKMMMMKMITDMV